MSYFKLRSNSIYFTKNAFSLKTRRFVLTYMYGGIVVEQICLVVEGRSDKIQLQKIVANNVHIVCTHGTKDEEALLEIIEPYEDAELFTFFDRDKSGDYLRKKMQRVYSEALQLQLPAPYIQVAETPLTILRAILNVAKIDVK